MVNLPNLIDPVFAQEWPSGDGKLKIYHYHLKEFHEFHFKKNGVYAPDEMERIHQAFRSRDQAGTIKIDPRLIDLLDHLEDKYQADSIEVISGYRSPELNQNLKESGRKVATKSLHIKGQAIDFHIDEVTEEKIRDYLLSLKLGGVGYYGSMDFIHADVGPVRTWSDSGPLPRKLIGVLDKHSRYQFISDQNDYFPSSPNPLFQADSLAVQNIKLERYSRGQWQIFKVFEKFPYPFPNLAKEKIFGKFRITFEANNEPGRKLSSNEFYFKKY